MSKPRPFKMVADTGNVRSFKTETALRRAYARLPLQSKYASVQTQATTRMYEEIGGTWCRVHATVSPTKQKGDA